MIIEKARTRWRCLLDCGRGSGDFELSLALNTFLNERPRTDIEPTIWLNENASARCVLSNAPVQSKNYAGRYIAISFSAEEDAILFKLAFEGWKPKVAA